MRAFRARNVPVGQRQFDILRHRQIADQVERLENESDFPIANACPFRRTKPLHRIAVQHVVALRRRIEQPQNGQQRRLPAARRAGDGDELAAFDLQMNAGQRVRFHFVGGENFV